MIQFTTSVAFLLSSIYGASQPAVALASTATAASTTDAVSAAAATSSAPVATSTADREVMESYLRTEFADTPILLAIAQCESDFRQFNPDGTVVRGQVDSHDVGVMQINETYWLGKSESLGDNIYTLAGNVAYAKYLYGKQGTDPWSSSEKCWSQSEPIAEN